MQLDNYQTAARKTAIYPNLDNNLVYPVLGLVNEAGELAGKLKKVMRDSNGVVTPEQQNAMAAELGDVLWYVSQVAAELGVSLNDVAQANLDKLQSRQERGVLGGSGDNR